MNGYSITDEKIINNFLSDNDYYIAWILMVNWFTKSFPGMKPHGKHCFLALECACLFSVEFMDGRPLFLCFSDHSNHKKRVPCRGIAGYETGGGVTLLPDTKK